MVKALKFQCVLAMLLAVIILVTLAAGCSGNRPETETTAPVSATGTAADAAPKDRIKMSWATWVSGPVDKNSFAEKELESAFPNIDFEFLAFERATWNDQMNTRVAGGDIPDIIYRTGQHEVKDYAKQGILAEVTLDMIRQNAPNVYQATISFGKEVWLACYYEDKFYGLPIMQPNQTRPMTNAWRKDWLDKVGVSKIPETLEEAEVVQHPVESG